MKNSTPVLMAVWLLGCSGGGDGSDGAPGEPPPKNVLVRIPAGSFTMGSPSGELGRRSSEVQHEVTISYDFYMQSTEVTRVQWDVLVDSDPSLDERNDDNACEAETCDTAPVYGLNWWETLAYANALSEAEDLAPCYELVGCEGIVGEPKDEDGLGGLLCDDVIVTSDDQSPLSCTGYRLPTEAEWEYAYRAGTTTAFYNGPISNTTCNQLDPNLDAIGRYCANGGAPPRRVADKQPNDWGLFDMSGNVWEWVWDGYGDYPEGSVEDPIFEPGFTGVVRGGSYNRNPGAARAANRDALFVDASILTYSGVSDAGGFRLVRSVP